MFQRPHWACTCMESQIHSSLWFLSASSDPTQINNIFSDFNQRIPTCLDSPHGWPSSHLSVTWGASESCLSPPQASLLSFTWPCYLIQKTLVAFCISSVVLWPFFSPLCCVSALPVPPSVSQAVFTGCISLDFPILSCPHLLRCLMSTHLAHYCKVLCTGKPPIHC